MKISLLALALISSFSIRSFAESFDSGDLAGDDVSNLSEQLESKNLPSQEKESWLKALKSYRAYKKSHPSEAETFKRGYRQIRAELKDKNSALAQNLSLARAACREQPDQCQRILQQLVAPSIEAKLQPTSTAWLDAFLPSAHADGMFIQGCSSSVLRSEMKMNKYGSYYQNPKHDNSLSFHALIVGSQQYTCDHRDVSLSVFGPGLSAEFASAMILTCSSDSAGLNVGVIAGASAVVGAKTGLFVGKSGLCSAVGFTWVGLGGYAGIAGMKLN